jgi:hypothetical protein
MAKYVQIGDTFIVGEDGDLSNALASPGPIAGALGPSGLWLSLSGDKIWNPKELIDAVNGLLENCPVEAVRVLATPALLVEAVSADRADGAINPVRDQRHVISFLGRCKAPHSFFVDEQIGSLGLMGGDVLQFCLPDYNSEMFLVDECAQAAVTAGRPEIACRAYAEAFQTNPYYAFQPLYRDNFELVALQAGDMEVPHMKASATRVFEDLTNTSALQQPPAVMAGVILRIFAPATVEANAPDAYPSVAPTPGHLLVSDLLMFGGLLVRYRYKNDLPSGKDLDFFTDLTAKRLQLDWDGMGELDRLKTELAAFHRFGTTMSSSGAVKPFLPEAVMLVEALRQGLPMKRAEQLLVRRIYELEMR